MARSEVEVWKERAHKAELHIREMQNYIEKAARLLALLDVDHQMDVADKDAVLDYAEALSSLKRNGAEKPPTAWKEHWLRAAQFLRSHDVGSDNFSEGWFEAAIRIEERAAMVDREPYTH